ncbi:2OG-Fe(II) oxygenase [Neptunomonas qingdaonensis]|uniref:2OG-Fe(II) oxygenase superfamily protein n=1 Tax=Neptunomonas qingdaonensis TaxID=1045558 RepID=A0A1I2TMV4_9GAMM|nr:2OG-Fe(II) oxygenase [Neptunomonas qingdaonensis]SFG66242.1 2OG-Fe(II) oxygenase superfamily protein [Neptunomonas qingdaonensis]
MFTIKEFEDFPIILVNDFLPDNMIDNLYVVLKEYEEKFNIPNWNSKDKSNSKKMSLCMGKDIWFPFICKEENENITHKVPSAIYDFIENYLFHQGLIEFFKYSSHDIFRVIPSQGPDGRFHIVSYGNGDYYNWHKDTSLAEGALLYGSSPSRNILFTFNLTLCKSNNLSGGDTLFMHNNKSLKIPFTNNSLVIFPTIINHAATKIVFKKEESWENNRFSLQFWMAGTQNFCTENIKELRW